MPTEWGADLKVCRMNCRHETTTKFPVTTHTHVDIYTYTQLHYLGGGRWAYKKCKNNKKIIKKEKSEDKKKKKMCR